MRVEYLLPAIALTLAVSACGSGDSGNVMAANANALEPALIDAALGPEPASEPEANAVSGNEAGEAPGTTSQVQAVPSDRGDSPASTEAAAEPAGEAETGKAAADEADSSE